MNRLAIALTMVLVLSVASFAQDSAFLTGQTISLSLEEVPLTTALHSLATQHGFNLVLSGDVEGNVSLRLENVSVATALSSMLTANGYLFFVKDNVIVVKSAEADATAEMESRIVNLKYLSPITAVKALATRKSEKGSLTILDKSIDGQEADLFYHATRILITDLPGLVDDLVALAVQLDRPEKSVLIEAKIIETTIDTESDLGINWPTSLGATMSSSSGETSGDETSSSGTDDGWSGLYDPANGNWTWGKLSVNEVSWVLNMLEQDGNSRLVSDPRVTTLENHEAQFEFNTIIPIQTINRFSEGASVSDIVTFEDEEVGISLRVIPRINEPGIITLEVEPTVEDIVRFTGPPDNQKPVTASRSIRTTITVKDGETVALGGLLKETEIETISRVPLLGRIPLLGELFTRRSKEKSSTDLLILITPHVID